VKLSPSKRTFPPASSARVTSSVSRMGLSGLSCAMPIESRSTGLPDPRHSVMRPGKSSSSVEAAIASCTGCDVNGFTAISPAPSRFVAPRACVARVTGSR
jgi:hypothetical protein